MTDDKEELIQLLNDLDEELNPNWTTHESLHKRIRTALKRLQSSVTIPEHTDAEYDDLLRRYQQEIRTVSGLLKVRNERDELKAKLAESEKAWKRYQHDWEEESP